MDCESWLLSKPTKSSPKVGFYIFFKWVGGQLALDLSLDGGRLALSYKGFFSFFEKFKKKKKTRERHMRVFSLHLKSSIKPGMHLLIALRVVSELDSYPDLLAGWSRMLFHFCDCFLPCVCVCVCVCVLVARSCLTLCNPMDCSPPGSFVYRVFQARILEGVAMLSSGDLPNPGIEPECLVSPALVGKFLPLGHLGSPFLSCTVR